MQQYLHLILSSTVTEDVEVDGYSFPRGTTVMSNLIYMHYDRKVCLVPLAGK